MQAASLIDGFDYALWMDADNHLVADCCEDLLGTLVALRHGWSYSSGKPAAYPQTPLRPGQKPSRCWLARRAHHCVTATHDCLPSDVYWCVLKCFVVSAPALTQGPVAVGSVVGVESDRVCPSQLESGRVAQSTTSASSPTRPARRTCRSQTSTSTHISQVLL